MGMRKAYIVAYNMACLLGWSACLIKTLQFIVEGLSAGALYKEIELVLQITQSLALLEILHAAGGLVRSPVMTVIQQVASRIFVVWGVLYVVPQVVVESLPLFKLGDVQVSIDFFSLMLAWGITEVVRYAFYATKEINCTPYILTWLRYTTFIVLYPIGVSSELVLAWLALAHMRKAGFLSYPMPNPVNMGFDYAGCCLAVMAGYVPGFPPVYSYMFRQRAKVLAPASAKKEV